MAKKRSKRRHEVSATVSIDSLTKAGSSIELEIYSDKTKIGTLVIGRGSFVWYGNKWKQGRRVPWSRFADLMESE